MDYEEAIEREDAMEWLLDSYSDFPKKVPAGDMSRNVSNPMFRCWRWILTLDREVVFGNCYQKCITKSDFDARKLVQLPRQSVIGNGS